MSSTDPLVTVRTADGKTWVRYECPDGHWQAAEAEKFSPTNVAETRLEFGRWFRWNDCAACRGIGDELLGLSQRARLDDITKS